MKYYIVLIYLFIATGLFAQPSDSFLFKDEGDNHLNKLYQSDKATDGVIISGKMLNGNSEVPIMLKLDTDGNVVWSTGVCLEKTLNHLTNFTFSIADDGFIYAVARFSFNDRSYSRWYYTARLYKIDAVTGEIVWSTADIEHEQGRYAAVRFIDLDDSRFLVGFSKNDLDITEFDKATGTVIDSYVKDISFTNGGEIIADSNSNLIFTEEKSLYKYNQTDFENVLWHTSFPNITEIIKIHEDKFGDLFVFTSKGTVKRVDPINGAEVWSTTSSSDTYKISDFVDTNEFLIITYRHLYVGGGTDSYFTVKLDKSNGDEIWRSAEHMTNHNSSATGGHESALSIDMDCNGDFYLSGYYGASNYGPQAMGLMKISGEDGTKIVDATITNYPNRRDDESVGQFAGVFGDEVVFLGTLEIEDRASEPVFVKTDTNLNVIEQKGLSSGFKHASGITQMLTKENSTYVLEQTGAKIKLVKYNGSNNALWSKSIEHGFFMQADYLEVGDNFAYVAGRGFIGNNMELMLYKISVVNGDIVAQVAVESTHLRSYQTYEIEVDNDTAYIYYGLFPYNSRHNTIQIRKWAGGVISDPSYASLFELFEEKKDENLVVNYGDNLFLINNGTKHLFNKNTLVSDTGAASWHYTEMRKAVQKDNIVYTIGKYNSGNSPYIQKYDLEQSRFIWIENLIELDGVVKELIFGEDDYLYVLIETDGATNLVKLSDITGDLVWNTNIPWPTAVTEAKELHFAFNSTTNQISRYSAMQKDKTDQDLLLQTFDTQGNLVSTETNETILDGIEEYSLAVGTNGSLLLGGIYTSDCLTNSEGFLVAMQGLNSVETRSDLDDDGVVDEEDNCPLLPGKRDNNGCPFELAVDNFSIRTSSETCIGSNNASIAVGALDTHAYEVSLTIAGAPVSTATTTFQNTWNATNLTAGNYQLCISIPTENYVQCFELEIKAPEALSGKSNLSDGRKYSLRLNGATKYTIAVNEQRFIMNAPDEKTEIVFEYELSAFENNIAVHTGKNCQGVFEEVVVITNDLGLKVYPNPVENELRLSIFDDLGTATLLIFDMNGKVIHQETPKLPLNNYTVDTSALVPGVYSVQLKTSKKTYLQRFIKK